MNDVNVELLVKAYVKIRDTLTERRREYDVYEKEMKERLAIIELELRRIADDSGVESFKTAYGTAYRTTKDFVAVKDWGQTVDFIFENDMRQLLNKSVNKTAVKEYMAANNNQLPPGVEYGHTVEMQVRRS